MNDREDLVMLTAISEAKPRRLQNANAFPRKSETGRHDGSLGDIVSWIRYFRLLNFLQTPVVTTAAVSCATVGSKAQQLHPACAAVLHFVPKHMLSADYTSQGRTVVRAD